MLNKNFIIFIILSIFILVSQRYININNIKSIENQNALLKLEILSLGNTNRELQDTITKLTNHQKVVNKAVDKYSERIIDVNEYEEFSTLGKFIDFTSKLQ